MGVVSLAAPSLKGSAVPGTVRSCVHSTRALRARDLAGPLDLARSPRLACVLTHERKAPPQLPRLARLGRQEDDDGRSSDDGVARGGAVGRRVQPLELPDLHGRRERSGRAGLRARLLPRVRRRTPRGQLRVPDLPPVRGHAAARRRPRAAREGASALQLRCAPPPPAARRAARPPPPPPASSAVGASRVAPARLSSRGRAAPRPRLAERRGHRLAAAAF